METETPLMTFWRGLNTECERLGITAPTYGAVRRLFEAAVEECRRDSDRGVIDAIRRLAA